MSDDKFMDDIFNAAAQGVPVFFNNEFLNNAVKTIVALGYDFKSHQPSIVGMDRIRFTCAEKGVCEVVYICDRPAASYVLLSNGREDAPASRQALVDFMQRHGVEDAAPMAEAVQRRREEAAAKLLSPKK